MSGLIDLKRVREIVNRYVRLAVGEIKEEEPRITFAVRGKWAWPPAKGKEVWRVNVEYTPKPRKEGAFIFSRTALFMIDAEASEVLEFKEGRYWTE